MESAPGGGISSPCYTCPISVHPPLGTIVVIHTATGLIYIEPGFFVGAVLLVMGIYLLGKALRALGMKRWMRR